MVHASYSWSGPQPPKGCGCIGFLSPMQKKDPRFLFEKRRGQPQDFWSLFSTIDGSKLPRSVWNTKKLVKHKKRSHEITYASSVSGVKLPELQRENFCETAAKVTTTQLIHLNGSVTLCESLVLRGHIKIPHSRMTKTCY